MNKQEPITGANPERSKLRNHSNLRESVCVDSSILRMLLLGSETDDVAKVAEAILLLKAALEKHGRENVKD